VYFFARGKEDKNIMEYNIRLAIEVTDKIKMKNPPT
jgi:hypothetical protein